MPLLPESWVARSFLCLIAAWALLEGGMLFSTVKRGARFEGDSSLGRFLVLLFTGLAVPPAAYLLTSGAFLPLRSTDAVIQAARIIGIAFMSTGLCIRVAAILQLRSNFSLSITHDTATRVVTNGMYGRIRHPSYLGSICLYTGYAVYVSWPTSAAVLFCVCAAHLIRIDQEEARLEGKFGAEYREYRKRTKRLIPRLY